MNSKALFLGLLASLTVARAQIAILPLDSRPVTRAFPVKLAQLVNEPVYTPEMAVLGNQNLGANTLAVKEWLSEHSGVRALFVSLDALAYGGLVQSRQDNTSVGLALDRLYTLKRWKNTYQKPIYAYITIPRYPDAKNRKRNLTIIQEMMKWAKEGVLDELRITWDDTQKNSPTIAEIKTLKAAAPSHVLFYPGADEVISEMVAHYLSPSRKRIKISFSDDTSKYKIMPYDALPLFETVRLHAESVGFELVYGNQDADLNLYVFNDFVGNIQDYAQKIKDTPYPVSVIDIQSVNQGNKYLWEALDNLKVTPTLLSLGAWGTPGNNLGTALAHAKLALDHPEPEKQKALLAYVYASDITYNSNIRAELRKYYPYDKVSSGVTNQLRSLLGKYLVFNEYYIAGAVFPWNRLMEVELELRKRP